MDYVKLRNIKKILKEVNSWKDDMARLTDRQLQEKTVEFRERRQRVRPWMISYQKHLRLRGRSG
ncbi:MAG: hypothetical protein ACLRZG_05085 [Streptococcus sp.]